MSQARQTGALRRWGEALAAVLIGNAAYFGVADYMPAALRHHPFRLDVGLVADFVFCVLAYGLVRLLWRR